MVKRGERNEYFTINIHRNLQPCFVPNTCSLIPTKDLCKYTRYQHDSMALKSIEQMYMWEK